ncbi:hypothetical protein [uncultured Aquimarina sp.]|uniref:hypothetical protein n=1 Tax=uncultured Aquimarina sp. TaxID=575652 RepID=UPI0026083B8E|nr:hypothetical protein [uncultured Aquimarina sp.]
MYSILNLVLLFFVIPAGLFFASNKIVPLEIFIYNNLLLYFIWIFSYINWDIKIPVLNKKEVVTVLLVIITIGIIPFIFVYGPYINLKNLLLIDVYKTRTLVTENVSNMYTAYTYSWYSKVLIPIIIVFCIYYRKRTALVFSFVFLMFLYLCGAHKMVFLGTFAVLLFYKYDYFRKTYLLIKFLIIVAIICIVLAELFDSHYFWSISLNRVFMLNPLIDYCFFDFFEGKPIYWSTSFMSRFIEYPYELSPDHIIGRDYLSNPKVNANTGIIANGFKNAGLIGIFINISFVSLFFSLLNYFRISSKFYGMFIVLIFTFTNASLTGSILTHGLLILFVMCMFVLRKTEYSLK